MKDILTKIKNIVGKKEPSLSDMYNKMNEDLKMAEDAIGGNFFPEEKVLTPEQVHYANLNLKNDSTFDDVQKNYKILKEKYNPEKFEKNSDNYNESLELTAKLDFSYAYFKNKFGVK